MQLADLDMFKKQIDEINNKIANEEFQSRREYNTLSNSLNRLNKKYNLLLERYTRNSEQLDLVHTRYIKRLYYMLISTDPSLAMPIHLKHENHFNVIMKIQVIGSSLIMLINSMAMNTFSS